MQLLGEKIYNLRKKKGLSQEDLALEIGVSRQTISKWESNTVQPNFENIKALCTVLEVPINSLIETELNIEVAADYANDNSSEANEIKTIEKPNKNILPILITSATISSVIFIITLIVSIIIGSTAFTVNTGDVVTTNIKYDTWAFILCIVFAILSFLASIVLWIKIIMLKKPKM